MSTSRTPGRRAASPTPGRRAASGTPGRRRVVEVGLVVLLLAASSGALALLGAEPAPQPVAVGVRISQPLDCPALPDQSMTLRLAASDQVAVSAMPVGTARTGDVSPTPAAEPPLTLLTPQDGRAELADQRTPLHLAPSSSELVAGLAWTAPGVQAWASCSTPRADQYVQLTGGAGNSLLLINSDASRAVVNVTLSGPGGPVAVPELRDLTVPGRTSVLVPVGDLAAGAGPLGARVTSTIGLVQASGLTTSGGVELAAASSSGTRLIVPAVTGSATSTRLVLTNPSTVRVEAQLQVLGSAGSFAPVGAERVTVEAQSTQGVDLAAALQGESVAITVTADSALAASVISGSGSDLGYSPARSLDEAGLELIGVPSAGTLVLSNPSAQASGVVIDWGLAEPVEAQLPAGATGGFPVPAEATRVRVRADQPLVGGLVMGGDAAVGLALAPLVVLADSSAGMPVQLDPRQRS